MIVFRMPLKLINFMLRSARPGFLSPSCCQNLRQSPNPKVSFTSLSKHKRKNIFMSQINRASPHSQKPSLLYSQYQLHENNKENVKQEYRLFTNAIREKSQRKSENPHLSNHISTPSTEYWNFEVKKNNLVKQPARKREERVHSKQKIEKMFQEVPKRLIRQKDKKQRQRAVCKIQNSVVIQGPKCEASLQTEMDFVNTSDASAQFDMSPHLY